MAKPSKFDFGGYLTKYGLKCDDGRVIQKDAFKEMDGQTVPLVWQHGHDEPTNILGHGILEHRPDGVYLYGIFNDSDNGKHAKTAVKHGDIVSLSVYANELIEKSKLVIHGVIREASLCLAGKNPGARIDNLAMAHADGTETPIDGEVIITTGLPLDLEEPPANDGVVKKVIKHAAQSGKTLKEVLDTFNEEQRNALIGILGQVLEGDEGDEGSAAHSNNGKGDDGTMKKNVFDGSAVKKDGTAITHADVAKILAETIADVGKHNGSFRDSFIAHAVTYGIENIEYLFPDAKTVTPEPTLISNDMTWVPGVLASCFHSPFSRIKTLHADITEATARARGYIKAGLKVDQFYKLLQRTTTPGTVYTKQKLDRDDVIDITTMDVIVWMKKLMQLLLKADLARAVLVSDGRDATLPGGAANPDKIKEDNVRPIWTDDDLYSVKVAFPVGTTTMAMIDGIVRARKSYKGSGNPTLYIGQEVYTDMILLKDKNDRRIYNTKAELAAALLVSDIVEVPLFDELSRETDDVPAKTMDLVAIMVNLKDYTIGADKGGEMNFFDDFDIDYNQLKYLLETRVSGALTLPHSALVFEIEEAAGPA